MKHALTLFVHVITVLAVLLIAHTAMANPINGTISQNGTQLGLGQDDLIDGQWFGESGDFTGLFYSPAGLSIRAWTRGASYSDGTEKIATFHVTSITSETITDGSYFAQGFGLFNLTGFDTTIATWQISSFPSDTYTPNGYWTNAFYIATNIAASDGGTTAAMIGLAIAGLILVRRRFLSQDIPLSLARARHNSQ
jgi:hypothetical protein